MRNYFILATLFSGCFSAVESEAEPLVGYAAVATNTTPQARGETYTWLGGTFEIQTHIPGCFILVGADELTERTECVVLSDAGTHPPRPEVWVFGPGRAYLDEQGRVYAWHHATLERTGQPEARVSFQPFP